MKTKTVKENICFSYCLILNQLLNLKLQEKQLNLKLKINKII